MLEKLPTWLKALLLIGALGLIATGIASLFESRPTDVVREQINLLRKNKFTEAYFDFTSKEFQKATSLEEFKEFIKPLLPILQTDETLQNYRLAIDTKVVRATFENQGSPVVIDYRLVLQGEDWKIFNIRWLGKEQEDMPEPAINEPETPVRAFLEMLKKQDIEGAYAITSQEFKNTISFNVFSEFIKNILIFGDFASYGIVTTALEKKIAVVKVLLYENDHISHVQLLTIVEDHEWKIRAIEILSSEVLKNIDGFKSEDLVKSIYTFMRDIKKGHLKNAYEKSTTEGFRKSTSFTELESFLKNYPFLVENEKVNIYKVAFDNDIAIVNIQLVSKNNEVHDIQFYLMQESNGWKIVQIKILDAPVHAQVNAG